jgi:ElaB/YqjD/DUF883 family membrane-anchored ribosome-binding protein
MTEKAPEKELDALKADIARLREEIAGLAAGVKKAAGIHAEQSHAAAQQEGLGVWADLLHKFDSSKIQSEKVVRDLSSEVEQHPLVSIMAAFGLGYIIAKLWYRGTNNEDTNDAP